MYPEWKIVEERPTGKEPSGRARRIWEGNIRMDVIEIVTNTSNWLFSALDRDYCECGI
jgi:hypothetical protein